MRVYLFHPSIDIYGGAEKVLLHIIETIHKKHDIFFYSYYRVNPDHQLLKKLRSYDIKIYIKRIPHKTLSYFIFLNLIQRTYNEKNKKFFHTFVDTGSLYVPYLYSDFNYVHFPIFYQHLYADNNFLSKIYSAPIFNLAKKIQDQCYTKITIFNSFYTKKLTLDILSYIKLEKLVECIRNGKTDVIYPPVNSMSISNYIQKNNLWNRENCIITISRIEYFKKLENVLVIANKLKKQNIRNLNIYLIGRITDKDYYYKLINLVARYNLHDIVKFKTNISEDEKLRLLSKCKVFFYPVENEHFGISVIEAMAAGLIPIVHNSGGPREFVSSKYRYDTLEDALILIRKNLYNWDKSKVIEVMKKSKEFDKMFFKRKIDKYLKEVFI